MSQHNPLPMLGHVCTSQRLVGCWARGVVMRGKTDGLDRAWAAEPQAQRGSLGREGESTHHVRAA
jgi:hypothetical protein